MPYTEQAKAMRRCSRPGCRGWAVWGDPRQLCRAHGGWNPRAAGDGRTRYPACKCGAYPWPHRPGGGLCRWPAVPLYVHLGPPGRHRFPRLRGYERVLGRGIILARRWRRNPGANARVAPSLPDDP